MTSVIYDNIFSAVTDDGSEAEDLRTRADLMHDIRNIIASNGWNHTAAAEITGLRQVEVWSLLSGHIDKLSTDLLMTGLSQAKALTKNPS
jgi:predicted XRE-type DNA-binding protein